ncbi:MAG: metallophosphoesterase [Actinomycetota bacterium]|nr:metallophosphoesterase [Actinomycetota bacterium]
MNQSDRKNCSIIITIIAVLLLALPNIGCTGSTPEKSRSKSEHKVEITKKDESKANFKFIVCGDPHGNYEIFSKILQAAKDVDFLIIAGDLTAIGSQEEFETFKRVMQETGIRYYAVPGNHDVASLPVSLGYEKYIAPARLSFDYKNSHFVLIDNSTPELGFYPEERAWVENDLKKAREKKFTHIFAVCHVPPRYPYSPKASKAQIAGIEANNFLVPVLSAGGVCELFCGHLHIYEREKEDNLFITVTGGAGGPHQEIFGTKSFYNYVLVSVNGKEYSEKVVRLE